MKNKITYKFLSQLYKLPKKVKVPVKFLNPTGEKSLAILLEESKKNNDVLLEIIKDFPQEKIKHSVFKHPVSGGMTMEYTIDFFTNHIIHHFHQLDRIEKHVNYPSS